MKTSDQTGSSGAYTQVVLYIVLCLLLAVMVYFQMYLAGPQLRIIDFKYKTNYYKKFTLPEGYDIETQGRKWANWHQDEKGIQKMCDLFNNSAGYINDNLRKKHGRLGMKLWQEWIVAFLNELEKTDIVNPGFQGFPWGGNWYQFTISVTTCMAYYIVNKGNSRAVNRYASRAIQYIIIDPQHSLGYERDKANSAMMVFPWTLSHMITGTLDVTNPGYVYAIEQYNLTPNQNIKANEDGIHLDYSYLTHNGVYAYGYLWSIYNIYHDTKQVIDAVKHFNLDYHIDMIYSKIKHRDIDIAGCALWHRYHKLDGAGFYNGNTKTRKCEIIPSMRYIRYHDKNVNWCARTMQTTVAYYESDQTVDDMGLYSSLCRRVFHENDDPVPKFPDVGFIYPTGTTELIRCPTTTSTTTPFYCKLIYTSKSFVWTDGEEFAVLFQYQMKLPPMLPMQFTEVLCVYMKEERIEAHYRLEALNVSIFLGDAVYDRIAGNEVDKEDGYLILKTDLKQKTYTSSIGPNEISAFEGDDMIDPDSPNHERGRYMPKIEQFTFGKYREMAANNGKTSSFYVQRKVNNVWEPYSYCPGEEDILTDTISPGDGNTYYMDKSLNQYQIQR